MLQLNILLIIYYICFIWLTLLLSASILILFVTGVQPFLIWVEVYLYQWYNYAAFFYILLRFIGSGIVGKKL